jgi:hypothetical protein
MEFWSIFWDDENDPDGNVEHIAEHDLTVEDVEHVLRNPTEEGVSKSTGFPAVWGYVPTHVLSSSCMKRLPSTACASSLPTRFRSADANRKGGSKWPGKSGSE